HLLNIGPAVWWNNLKRSCLPRTTSAVGEQTPHARRHLLGLAGGEIESAVEGNVVGHCASCRFEVPIPPPQTRPAPVLRGCSRLQERDPPPHRDVIRSRPRGWELTDWR